MNFLGSLENHTQVRTQTEIEFVPVFTPCKQRREKKFKVLFLRTGCKEKRTGRANFVVFHLLIGLISVAVAVAVAVTVAFVVAPRIYRFAHTVTNPKTFSVKTPAIFSLDIYVIQD